MRNISDLGDLENGLAEDDCAICMCNLATNVNEQAEAIDGPNLVYMLTPCGHKFHKPCLR